MQFFSPLGKENLTKTHAPTLLFTSVWPELGHLPTPDQSLTKRKNKVLLKKTSRHDPFAGPGQVAVLNIIRRIYQ